MAESTMADLNENDYPAEVTIGDQWARGLRQPQKLAGKPLPSSAALHCLISKVAYHLYLRRGKVHGHDFEDWQAAEALVRSRRTPTEKPVGDHANGK